MKIGSVLPNRTNIVDFVVINTNFCVDKDNRLLAIRVRSPSANKLYNGTAKSNFSLSYCMTQSPSKYLPVVLHF